MDGGGGHAYYVLIETSGSDAIHDGEKLEGFLEAAMELVSEGRKERGTQGRRKLRF